MRRAGVRTLAEAEVHHEGERRRLGPQPETTLSLGSGAFAQVNSAAWHVRGATKSQPSG